MAGSYCNFCDRRCFVYRIVPGLRITHWATCHLGALNDMAMTGYDFTTAHNPFGDCGCKDCADLSAHKPTADGPTVSSQESEK